MLPEIDADILKEFHAESSELLSQCKSALEEFTSTGNSQHFEKYGLFIDRIMGAAYTIGLKQLGDLARLGKELGYKGSQVVEMDKLLALQGLLSQLLAEMERHLKGLKKKNYKMVASTDLVARLEKASQSLGNLRASVKI